MEVIELAKLEQFGIKIDKIIGANPIEYLCTIPELNIEISLTEPLSILNIYQAIYEQGILKGIKIKQDVELFKEKMKK